MFAFSRNAACNIGYGPARVEHPVRQTQQAHREGRMARARGAPRDANPYRREASPGHGTLSPMRHVTAEERLATRLETAWRIGWEAVERELSDGPAPVPDARRRVSRPEDESGS